MSAEYLSVCNAGATALYSVSLLVMFIIQFLLYVPGMFDLSLPRL